MNAGKYKNDEQEHYETPKVDIKAKIKNDINNEKYEC